MTFLEALKLAFDKKEKIRRKIWKPNQYLYGCNERLYNQDGRKFFIYEFAYDIIENTCDWEIFTGKRKIKLRDLTKEQYEKWINENCNARCETCLFRRLMCEATSNACWIKDKSIFSNKFLDTEIEID